MHTRQEVAGVVDLRSDSLVDGNEIVPPSLCCRKDRLKLARLERHALERENVVALFEDIELAPFLTDKRVRALGGSLFKQRGRRYEG